MRCLRLSGRAIIISRTPFFTKSNTPIASSSGFPREGHDKSPGGEGKSTIARTPGSRYRFDPLAAPHTIDISVLPPNAQKILDPNGPAPLKGMAAKGLAPGLKPGETLAVICALSLGTDTHAEVARKTLAAHPLPLLNGALSGEIQSGVL